MAAYRITRFTRRRSKRLWVATVVVDEPHGTDKIHFSRYDTEDKWHADAYFGPNGIPHFCHGEGSRCTLQRFAIGDVADELDQRKHRFTVRAIEYFKHRAMGMTAAAAWSGAGVMADPAQVRSITEAMA